MEPMKHPHTPLLLRYLAALIFLVPARWASGTGDVVPVEIPLGGIDVGRVNDLAVAEDVVWAAGEKGMVRVSRRQGKSTVITEIEGRPAGSFGAVEISRSGEVWAGGVNGLARLEPAPARWMNDGVPELDPGRDLQKPRVLDLSLDPSGGPVVLCPSGILRTDGKKHEWILKPLADTPTSGDPELPDISGFWDRFFVDSSDQVWLHASSDLWRGTRGKWVKVVEGRPIDLLQYLRFVEDGSEVVWLSCPHSLARFQGEGGTRYWIPEEIEGPLVALGPELVAIGGRDQILVASGGESLPLAWAVDLGPVEGLARDSGGTLLMWCAPGKLWSLPPTAITAAADHLKARRDELAKLPIQGAELEQLRHDLRSFSFGGGGAPHDARMQEFMLALLRMAHEDRTIQVHVLESLAQVPEMAAAAPVVEALARSPQRELQKAALETLRAWRGIQAVTSLTSGGDSEQDPALFLEQLRGNPEMSLPPWNPGLESSMLVVRILAAALKDEEIPDLASLTTHADPAVRDATLTWLAFTSRPENDGILAKVLAPEAEMYLPMTQGPEGDARAVKALESAAASPIGSGQQVIMAIRTAAMRGSPSCVVGLLDLVKKEPRAGGIVARHLFHFGCPGRVDAVKQLFETSKVPDERADLAIVLAGLGIDQVPEALAQGILHFDHRRARAHLMAMQEALQAQPSTQALEALKSAATSSSNQQVAATALATLGQIEHPRPPVPSGDSAGLEPLAAELDQIGSLPDDSASEVLRTAHQTLLMSHGIEMTAGPEKAPPWLIARLWSRWLRKNRVGSVRLDAPRLAPMATLQMFSDL